MSREDLLAGVFSKMDKDGDGIVTQAEMQSVFKVFDPTGSGTVSKATFLETFQTVFQGSEEKAQRVYARLDAADKGDIKIDQVNNLFSKLDPNGKGELTKAEFIERYIALTS